MAHDETPADRVRAVSGGIRSPGDAADEGAAEAWIHGDAVMKNPSGYRPGREGESDRHTGRGGYALRFAIVFTLLLVLAVLLTRRFGGFGSGEGTGQLVYAILMALFVSATLAAGRIWKNVQYLAIWAGIFILCWAIFSFRYELTAVKDRMVAELVPAEGYRGAPGTISYPMSDDGHFHIMAEVNGTPVRFLADTGASHIVLSPADATRLGMDPDRLVFDRFYRTANGTVRGSSIRIDDFRIGGIHLERIGASVNEAAMSQSLLGMTFFNRLDSYEVKERVLTLRWTP